MHGARRVQAKCARGPCDCGEAAKCRSRVPPLADMLRAHAESNAWSDLIAGNCCGEKLSPAHPRSHFANRDQREQYHCDDIQHAGPMNIVELKPLNLRTVLPYCMR